MIDFFIGGGGEGANLQEQACQVQTADAWKSDWSSWPQPISSGAQIIVIIPEKDKSYACPMLNTIEYIPQFWWR